MTAAAVMGTAAMQRARYSVHAAAVEVALAMRDQVLAGDDLARVTEASKRMVLYGAAVLAYEPVTALSWFFQWAIEEAAQ